MSTQNYEEFNQDKYLQQLKTRIDKPNILLCGSDEAGKRSLIDTMFITDGSELLPSKDYQILLA